MKTQIIMRWDFAEAIVTRIMIVNTVWFASNEKIRMAPLQFLDAWVPPKLGLIIAWRLVIMN
jgi:hypothetical protein